MGKIRNWWIRLKWDLNHKYINFRYGARCGLKAPDGVDQREWDDCLERHHKKVRRAEYEYWFGSGPDSAEALIAKRKATND